MPNEYPLRTTIFLITIYRRHYKKKMTNPTPIGFFFFLLCLMFNRVLTIDIRGVAALVYEL